MANRRVVLLVNDSPFASTMAAPRIRTYDPHQNVRVVGVVVLRATVRSSRRLSQSCSGLVLCGPAEAAPDPVPDRTFNANTAPVRGRRLILV
jgi:hypothetical protein